MIQIERFFAFSMVLLFISHVIGCTTRLAVDKTTLDAAREEVIYVILKNEKIYKVANSRFEGDFLVGIVTNGDTTADTEKVRIALDDIQAIEVIRPDKKKFVRNYVIVMIGLISAAVILDPFGAFRGSD